MNTRISLLFVVLALIAITAVAAHGETSAWSTLNQILNYSGSRAYFRYSPQPDVYCAGVTVIDNCSITWDGQWEANIDTYGNLDCHLNPNKPSIGSLWYLADNDRFLTTAFGASGRIYNGDQITPKLVMNYLCSIQVLDNIGGSYGKKNMWVLYTPLQLYP